MKFLQKIIWGLTLVSAGLAALIFPVTLFALQGMGRIGLEEVAFMLVLYLIQPVSIVLIFLVCLGKFASVRLRRMATGIVAFNAVCLLAISALIGGGVLKGDAILPIVFAAPSFLFLLNACIAVLSGAKQQGKV